MQASCPAGPTVNTNRRDRVQTWYALPVVLVQVQASTKYEVPFKRKHWSNFNYVQPCPRRQVAVPVRETLKSE